MQDNSVYYRYLYKNSHIKYLDNYTKVQNGIRYVFYACIVNAWISA